MKIILVLIALIVGCAWLQPPEPQVTVARGAVTPTPLPSSSPTPIYIDDDEEAYVFDDVLDYEGLMNVCTRPIVARTVLRSKPWEDSKPNLDVALVPGDIVQIYPNPAGESEWVEVWVPRYRVTGYVRMVMLGEVK